MSKKYKILFYLEPWLEICCKDDDYRCKFIRGFFSKIFTQLPSFEIHFLISDFHHSSLPQKAKEQCTFHIIETSKLYGIFQLQSNYDYHNYTSETSQFERNYIEYLESLNLPQDIDLIYSISSNLHYLNQIYKTTPKLFLEAGAINGYKGIVKNMFYLDFFTHNKGDSFLNEYYDELTSQKLTNADLIKKVQNAMLSESSSIFIDSLRKNYKNIYLLAVENFDSALAKLYFTRHNIMDYLSNIASQIPQNSVIIITQHKRYKFVTPTVVKFLEQYGIKIIFDESVKSNEILPYVDGLISCFSTLILNAIILEKPVFVSSEKSYLWKYSDAKSIKDFIKFVEGRKLPNKNKLAAFSFLLKKYYINNNQLVNCNEYLKSIVEYHQTHKTIDFNFYQTQSTEILFRKPKMIRAFKAKVKNFAKNIILTFKRMNNL